jgi:hypothetical protein
MWVEWVVLTNQPTNQPRNSMEQIPSWNANCHSDSQEISPFYETGRFITVFIKAQQWSISWARYLQSATSHTISLRSILILYFYLRLDLPSGLLPSGFPTKLLYAFLVSPMPASCLAHFNLPDLITLLIFGEAYKLRSFSLCSFLQPPASFSLLGREILLSTLFSDILNRMGRSVTVDGYWSETLL